MAWWVAWNSAQRTMADWSKGGGRTTDRGVGDDYDGPM